MSDQPVSTDSSSASAGATAESVATSTTTSDDSSSTTSSSDAIVLSASASSSTTDTGAPLTSSSSSSSDSSTISPTSSLHNPSQSLIALGAAMPAAVSISGVNSASSPSFSLCPNNTSECLLRHILDLEIARDAAKANSTDWDPINVGLTAVIGFLALVIAVVAVFQSLLAAGPGRLKASQTAIGRYSRFSRSRFSWIEMRLRSTAYTPMIDAYALYRLKSKPMRETPTTPSSAAEWSKEGKGFDKSATTAAPGEPQPPAGWLILLEYIHLSGHEDFPKIACHTDYLPQDLYAPPAYSDVFSICVLALVSGCNSLHIDGKYPRVQGLHAQLYFRDHPQLGDVAVYERYPSRADGAETWQECDIPAAMRYAGGELMWDDDLLVSDRFFRLNGTYSGMRDMDLLPIFKKMRRMLPGTMDLEDNVYSTALGALPCLSGLLLCSVNVRDAVAFGVSSAEPKNVLRQLGLALGYLPRHHGDDSFVCALENDFRFHGFEPIDDPFYTLVPADRGPWLTQANAALSFDYDGRYDAIFQINSAGQKMKIPVIFRHNLVTALLDWLDTPAAWVDPALFSQHTGGLMVEALNKILGFYGTPYAVTGFWDLLSEPSLRQNNLRAQQYSTADLDAVDGLKAERPESESMRFIKRVLWLRALCLAAYLASLPDTSMLVDTELGQRILPVL
ncbi:hypothetical protein TWF694_003713 [Orbilia ellipsospora]|uniref:Uncharacterized protein n=1 Tax=Orbilia ellipsospora TaxID=2528407 RepID=A0AAV9WYY6_9PEZI